LTGTRWWFSGFNQPRQCGEVVLRIFGEIHLRAAAAFDDAADDVEFYGEVKIVKLQESYILPAKESTPHPYLDLDLIYRKQFMAPAGIHIYAEYGALP
jgi:hypothetical protein